MPAVPKQLEQRFFRALNSVVEPTVRRGLFSNRLAPSTLIVLESTGYVSGSKRRTPLLANRLGPLLILSTVRGDRSFWVRNVRKDPSVSYYIGGRQRAAHALVISNDSAGDAVAELPAILRPLAKGLQALAKRGWAFAILRQH